MSASIRRWERGKEERKRKRTLELIESEDFGTSTTSWYASPSRMPSVTQSPIWDAAILAAAEALGGHTVYSEDLDDGQPYGRVRVVNPFS